MLIIDKKRTQNNFKSYIYYYALKIMFIITLYLKKFDRVARFRNNMISRIDDFL